MARNPVLIVLEQGRALTAALSVIEFAEEPKEALRLIRRVAPLIEPENVIEAMAARAMAHVGGTEPVQGESRPIDGSLADAITVLCTAMHALIEDTPVDMAALQPILEVESIDEATHAMVVRFWAKALHALTTHERTEARRFFRRAVDLAASFGVESQPAIAWGYVAFFFPRE